MKKNSHVLTNPHLRAMFNRFNRMFFNGDLQEPTEIRFDPKLNVDGKTSWRTSGAIWITIHRNFRSHPIMVAIILLHEMVHVKLGLGYKNSHGIRFGAEIVNLFLAGAYDDLL